VVDALGHAGAGEETDGVDGHREKRYVDRGGVTEDEPRSGATRRRAPSGRPRVRILPGNGHTPTVGWPGPVPPSGEMPARSGVPRAAPAYPAGGIGRTTEGQGRTWAACGAWGPVPGSGAGLGNRLGPRPVPGARCRGRGPGWGTDLGRARCLGPGARVWGPGRGAWSEARRRGSAGLGTGPRAGTGPGSQGGLGGRGADGGPAPVTRGASPRPRSARASGPPACAGCSPRAPPPSAARWTAASRWPGWSARRRPAGPPRARGG